MTVSNDLFLAILSLDAYNRGYNAGTIVSGSSIGTAAVATSSGTAGEAVGFYAQAYTWNGKTVISYRGTDNPMLVDVWYGWTLGAGFPTVSQAELALQFYNSVMSTTTYAPASPNVVLTGHAGNLGTATNFRTLCKRWLAAS